MTPATIQERAEIDRVAALEACEIVDTPPEEAFDFIARLAAEVCGTRMAGITFIDAERQFYKSAVGMVAPVVRREESFCRHTVDSGAPVVVTDALDDDRFRTSTLVTGEPGIRFYAAAPLMTREGQVLGALCVMDGRPQKFEPHRQGLLQGLAQQVMALVEQRHDERELRLVRRRHGNVGRIARVADWEWDPVADAATWTPELRALLGVDADVEGNFTNLLAVVHEEDRADLMTRLVPALEAGGPFSFRLRVVHADGDVRTLDSEVQVETSEDGSVSGMWGVSVDVTDLVEAERVARERADGLSAAFEAALDPILVCDDDRRYVQVNRAACELLGYERDELLGMRVEDLVLEPARPHAIAAWNVFIETGELRGEMELRTADGTMAPIEFTGKADFVPGRHISMLRDITERQEAEEQAKEGRQRLEETQALALVGSWEWDLASELQVMSDELMRILGRDAETRQPSYEEFLSYVLPEDRDAFVEVVSTALETGEAYTQEFRIRAESGEVRTIESHGRVKFNAAGKPVRMVGAAQDITERKRAEDELRLQAEVLDQLSVGVVASGGDRGITQWNEGAVSLFGLTRDEVLGRRFDDLGLMADTSVQVRTEMHETLSRGKSWEGEAELRDSTGRYFPALITNEPVRDRRGGLVGYVGVIVDVSEQRTIESELRIQSQVLEQVEAGVIALDTGRRVTQWNRGAERLYGWSAVEAVGRRAADLDLVAPGAEGTAEELRSAVEATGRWEGEMEVRRRDGSTFPVLSSNSLLHDAAGAPIGTIGVTVDISDRKRAEQEAREARLETITRLARAVETRDPETGGHIERIGEFAAMIAERLGLPREEVDAIRVSSPMHDVGKIGIADEVLLKPGPLTASERAVMQEHTSIGHDILAGSKSAMLDMAARIALSHHERVDGGGYPQGLAGDAIPLEGRIVAVADVFDALTSDRVYRQAFTVEKALEMMEEGRGSQFEPAILDVLVADVEAFVSVPVAGGDG